MLALAQPDHRPAAWPALREELQLHPAGTNPDGSPAWHIADPARNLYFRIGWLEFEILGRWSQADPDRIAADIRASTTLVPEGGDIAQFMKFLEARRLLQSAAPAGGQGKSLWNWLLHHYLFIRIPLLRPARLLARLVPRTAFLFTPWFGLLSALAALSALLLGLRQADAVAAHLARAFTWQGGIGFLAALALSKLIHETAHALVATRHGVRVGHMGIALVVMLPMAYTDTGESWKLAEPRHRLAIAAAGVLAELSLAAWCSLAWIFCPDGMLREALFFLATTAWVWTLAINASPFMRFDGYFIVADWLDLPGLHERAAACARQFLRHALLGLEEPHAESLPARYRAWLTGFAIATWVYRFGVFLGIAILVYNAFFKSLGIVLFAVEIWVFILQPVVREIRHCWLRRAEIKGRARILWAGATTLAATLALSPLPTRIVAPGVMHAGGEHVLYAPFPARIESFQAAEGRVMRQGEMIVELSSPRQAVERDKAAALAEGYGHSARGAIGFEHDGAARQNIAEQQRIRWRAEVDAREAEMQRLRISYDQPTPGVLRDVDPSLAPGSWVAANTPIATVITPGAWQIEAMVAEQDIERLRPGGLATIVVEGRTQVLEGRITIIENTPAARLPHRLLAAAHGGPLATLPGTPEQLKPADALYRVVIQGSGDRDGPAQRRVRAHLQGEARSPALHWAANALSVFIQQAGF
jgi:putative peptide zinc metalloprotease protein